MNPRPRPVEKSVTLSGIRPRHSRTRAGCLSCRSRKKKCDEAKPRCAGCRRNMLDCEWPPGVSFTRDSSEDGRHTSVVARHTSDSPCLSTPQPSSKAHSPFAVINAGYGERACGLTPQSVPLLSHYLRETASHLAMTTPKDNPFITVLLPLGYVDDLLMHSLLALSGAHLTYKDPCNVDYADATRLHYSRLIEGLRIEVATLQDGDLERRERLLRVLMVTCHYEAISGNTQGSIFNHLRASRNLIISLLNQRSGNRLPGYEVNMDALGFSVELYTYLVFCNNITPYGIAPDRSLPLDSFVMSVQDTQSSFPTFGALFAGSHELFQLVPEVSLLASQRLTEEVTGISSGPSASMKRAHDNIHQRVTSWNMKPPREGENRKSWEHKQIAAETLREGLLIYLTTALAGSTVSDPAVICAVQDHVRKLFSYTPELLKSPEHVATMTWPIVMGGSCMVKANEQQALVREMRISPYSMSHIEILADVLQLLWDDPDPRAYGPYGLYLTMKKHGISISIV